MLHQIRKMISKFDVNVNHKEDFGFVGLVIAIVRGIASRDTIQQAYNADKVQLNRRRSLIRVCF